MIREHLLRWQWTDYARYHTRTATRILHLLGAPLFITGTLAIPTGLATGNLLWAALGPAAMLVGFGAQGIAHSRIEPNPAIPFAGPADALTRIFTEQFITFWRFVLSGFRGPRTEGGQVSEKG